MVGDSRVIQIKDVKVGDNIRRIRKEKGYKQTEVVSQLQLRGYDISTYGYNKIEKGIQNPTVSILLYLCQILECDMNALFDFKS